MNTFRVLNYFSFSKSLTLLFKKGWGRNAQKKEKSTQMRKEEGEEEKLWGKKNWDFLFEITKEKDLGFIVNLTHKKLRQYYGILR